MKISWASSASLDCVSAPMRPSATPRSRMRARFRPPPSSRNSTATSLPSWATATVIWPAGSLPAAWRASGSLDAVRHAVAQQVLEGAAHALEHAAVDFDRAADEVQSHLLLQLLGGLAHDAVQAVGQALELDHARAQQVVLQVARQARLRGQVVFGGLQRALQAALHGGHVVDRLGHHARQFLEAREAVHLERVEGVAVGLGRFHARADLGLGLQFDLAQLVAQAFEVFGQVGQRTLQLADFGLDARARDAHFAGVVDQAVEQGRAHAHRAAGGARLGCDDRRRLSQRRGRRCAGDEALPVDRRERAGHERPPADRPQRASGRRRVDAVASGTGGRNDSERRAPRAAASGSGAWRGRCGGTGWRRVGATAAAARRRWCRWRRHW